MQSSPISQRVSFLESKGLTSQEIDLALGQVGRASMGPMGATPGTVAYQQQQYQQRAPYPMMPAYPPARPQRDWRDWFIMTVVSGTVGYGVIALARRYLYPHLQPPNQTVLEEERDALAAKYDEVAMHLEELEQTTEAMSQGLADQQTAIQESVRGVNDLVAESRVREEQRDKDLEQMKSEIESMREEFTHMLDRSRKSSITALTDLQGELKSLRSLLVSRGGLSNSSSSAAAASPASTSTPAPTSNTTTSNQPSGSAEAGSEAPPTKPPPQIPAWQLAESHDD